LKTKGFVDGIFEAILTALLEGKFKMALGRTVTGQLPLLFLPTVHSVTKTVHDRNSNPSRVKDDAALCYDPF